MRTRLTGWPAIGGLGALLLAVGAVAPAHADDGYYDSRPMHREYRHIREDREDIHGDFDRLHDLYRARDREADRGDWRDVRRLDWQIDHLRDHIRHDIYDVRRDRQRFDHDRY